MIDRFTEGAKRKPPLYGPISAVELYNGHGLHEQHRCHLPRYTELDSSLRLNHSLKKSNLLVLRMCIYN